MRIQKSQYKQTKVAGNGDCGYSAFGVERENAIALLKNNLKKIKAIIFPAVSAALLEEGFQKYLQEKNINANYNDDEGELLTNEALFEAYITYDVEEKKINGGWAHPAILHALAEIQKIELHIWKKDGEDLVPHKLDSKDGENNYDYSTYKPEDAIERRDIVFLNGNHFDIVESDLHEFNLKKKSQNLNNNNQKKFFDFNNDFNNQINSDNNVFLKFNENNSSEDKNLYFNFDDKNKKKSKKFINNFEFNSNNNFQNMNNFSENNSSEDEFDLENNKNFKKFENDNFELNSNNYEKNNNYNNFQKKQNNQDFNQNNSEKFNFNFKKNIDINSNKKNEINNINLDFNFDNKENINKKSFEKINDKKSFEKINDKKSFEKINDKKSFEKINDKKSFEKINDKKSFEKINDKKKRKVNFNEKENKVTMIADKVDRKFLPFKEELVLKNSKNQKQTLRLKKCSSEQGWVTFHYKNASNNLNTPLSTLDFSFKEKDPLNEKVTAKNLEIADVIECTAKLHARNWTRLSQEEQNKLSDKGKIIFGLRDLKIKHPDYPNGINITKHDFEEAKKLKNQDVSDKNSITINIKIAQHMLLSTAHEVEKLSLKKNKIENSDFIDEELNFKDNNISIINNNKINNNSLFKNKIINSDSDEENLIKIEEINNDKNNFKIDEFN